MINRNVLIIIYNSKLCKYVIVIVLYPPKRIVYIIHCDAVVKSQLCDIEHVKLF